MNIWNCGTVWTALEAVGTIAASFIALFTLRSLKDQLKVEQEPYVVVFDDVSKKDDRGFRIKIRNVGRGPAFGITGCILTNVEHCNDAFFGNDQPHSKSLFAGQSSSWIIDINRMKELKDHTEGDDNYRTFYLFYKSQLGKRYRSKIKLKVISDTLFVIMDCYRIEV